MKHAYLILAHHEFEVLRLLVAALDDRRNDIYIHIDRKVKVLPHLQTTQAGLYILSDRVDVRWGDLSVVEAEFALFEAAHSSRQPYSYYHLLSGVDLPLKSQDYIHRFFERHSGKEFVGYYRGEGVEADIDRKVRRWHLFPRDFRSHNWSTWAKRTLRFIVMHIQISLGLRRHTEVEFKKGTQWVSITQAFVAYLLERKATILARYHHSFCSDEIFIQTELWHSPYKGQIYDTEDEARGCMRYIGWEHNILRDFTPRDLTKLQASDLLWARKFNSQDFNFLREVLKFPSSHLSTVSPE